MRVARTSGDPMVFGSGRHGKDPMVGRERRRGCPMRQRPAASVAVICTVDENCRRHTNEATMGTARSTQKEQELRAREPKSQSRLPRVDRRREESYFARRSPLGRASPNRRTRRRTVCSASPSEMPGASSATVGSTTPDRSTAGEPPSTQPRCSVAWLL